jgi:hypothetical protein
MLRSPLRPSPGSAFEWQAVDAATLASLPSPGRVMPPGAIRWPGQCSPLARAVQSAAHRSAPLQPLCARDVHTAPCHYTYACRWRPVHHDWIYAPPGGRSL